MVSIATNGWHSYSASHYSVFVPLILAYRVPFLLRGSGGSFYSDTIGLMLWQDFNNERKMDTLFSHHKKLVGSRMSRTEKL